MIREKLEGKTGLERTGILADEIIKAANISQFVKDGLDIQIQSIEKIDGGISVLAKAFRDGEPIGFGPDGTVEIERFKIYNPQFTVEDSNGDIVKEFTNSRGEFISTKAREDATEALRAELAHTIKVVGRQGGKIVSGKIGNTTSTFNPVSGANSPVDGWIERLDDASWDACHDATDGTVTRAFPSGTQDWCATVRWNGALARIARAIFLFDTSTIPDSDTISSAVFSLYATATQDGDNDGNDFISVVTSNPASNANVVVADYDQVGDAINNPTEQHDTGERKDISSISTGAYLDWTLNATGIGNISKTGVTKFGTREGHDILDDQPASSGSYNYLEVRYADDVSGTPPKLVVVHASGGGGTVVQTDPTLLTMGVG